MDEVNKEKGKEIGKHFVTLIKNGGTDDPAVNGIGKGKSIDYSNLEVKPAAKILVPYSQLKKQEL